MIEKNWQNVTQTNVVKNVIAQVTNFLNGPMVNCFSLSYCFISKDIDFLTEILQQSYP